MQSNIRLATRKSRLALHQSMLVRDALISADSGLQVELIEVSTTGDRQQDWSLQNEGGVGLFTKELENLLLTGAADIAVHSSKDLPAIQVDGLAIAGYLPRGDAHDVLVLREKVPAPSTIATGSPRRREQLRQKFPEASWLEIRGNVETRLNKICEGYADATVLAAAGLARLGIQTRAGIVFKPLSKEEVVPAPGQGAIAVQCRVGEENRLPSIFCEKTGHAVGVEKRLLSLLGGGCHSCIGGFLEGNHLFVFHEDSCYYKFEIHAQDEAGTEIELQEIVKSLRKR